LPRAIVIFKIISRSNFRQTRYVMRGLAVKFVQRWRDRNINCLTCETWRAIWFINATIYRCAFGCPCLNAIVNSYTQTQMHDRISCKRASKLDISPVIYAQLQTTQLTFWRDKKTPRRIYDRLAKLNSPHALIYCNWLNLNGRDVKSFCISFLFHILLSSILELFLSMASKICFGIYYTAIFADIIKERLLYSC